jgi:hypothetical protein
MGAMGAMRGMGKKIHVIEGEKWEEIDEYLVSGEVYGVKETISITLDDWHCPGKKNVKLLVKVREDPIPELKPGMKFAFKGLDFVISEIDGDKLYVWLADGRAFTDGMLYRYQVHAGYDREGIRLWERK